jgi:hypothetical protein
MSDRVSSAGLEAVKADTAPFDDRDPYVGYWDGLDAEQTIAEIDCLERIFAVS